jgi:hypothetical protein
LAAIALLQLLLFGSVPAAGQDVGSDGGLVPGGRVVIVTTLASDGPGSLRAALSSPGPRVVLFAVGGTVNLQSDLIIEHGQVTIAGESAPSPGVILRNGTLRIRASDVVISHLSVYPGSSTDPKAAENRDGITVYGSPSRRRSVGGVVLRNLSVGWGVDENIGLQGLTDGVRIENALIAQPLRNGGHPKGAHAMNVLLGNLVGRVVITNSVLAASDQRSPRLTSGNRVSFVNNLVFGHGRVATHIDRSREIFNSGVIDIIGNAYIVSGSSSCREPLIRIDRTFFDSTPATSVHLGDNIIVGEGRGCTFPPASAPGLSPQPVAGPAGKTLPARSVFPDILRRVGAHPAQRSALDRRILDGISSGSLPILENEAAHAAEADWPQKSHALSVPAAAGALAGPGVVGQLRAWLCTRHRAVSGADARCPD